MWLTDALAGRLDLLLAGLAGGFMSLYAYKDISLKRQVYLVICGGLSGVYAAPFAAEWYFVQKYGDVVGDNAKMFAALFLGIFGPALINTIMRGITEAQVWEIIKARFNIRS